MNEWMSWWMKACSACIIKLLSDGAEIQLIETSFCGLSCSFVRMLIATICSALSLLETISQILSDDLTLIDNSCLCSVISLLQTEIANHKCTAKFCRTETKWLHREGYCWFGWEQFLLSHSGDSHSHPCKRMRTKGYAKGIDDFCSNKVVYRTKRAIVC